MPRNVERGVAAGFADDLTQPLEVKNLLSTWNSLLNTRQEFP